MRLDPELRAAVEARATADQTTTSDVIREALRRFLDVAQTSVGARDYTEVVTRERHVDFLGLSLVKNSSDTPGKLT